jgi:hypothetical protein
VFDGGLAIEAAATAVFDRGELAAPIDVAIVDETVAVIVAPVAYLGLGLSRCAGPALRSRAQPAT